MRSGCRRRSWTVLRRSFSIPSYKRINTPERLLLRAVPSAPHLLQTSSSNPHSLVNLQIVESLTTPAFGSQPFDRWRTGFAGRALANLFVTPHQPSPAGNGRILLLSLRTVFGQLYLFTLD